MRDRLSAVIITYNESQNIKACLESVGWADEIVVVDSFSTDDTVRICYEYTQKIYQQPWPGYGSQKNFGIGKASGDWILILDADERVSPDLKQEIQTVMDKPLGTDIVAYEIPRKNYFWGRWVRWAGQYPDYQIRLFKKGKARYNDKKLHENLIVEGKVSRLNSPIEHYSYRSLSHWLHKLNTYTRLMEEEQSSQRKRVTGFDLFFRPVSTFIKMFILRKGYRGGICGIIISAFASFFTFLKYARGWERLYSKR